MALSKTSDTFGQLDASKPAQLRSFSRYFPSLVVGPAVADLEVGFELRHCEMFPFLGLLQERPALKGTEGGSLTVQADKVFNRFAPIRPNQKTKTRVDDYSTAFSLATEPSKSTIRSYGRSRVPCSSRVGAPDIWS